MVPISSHIYEVAFVEEKICPSSLGRVRFQGSRWPAFSEKNLTFVPGDKVRVVGRINITLLVDALLDEIDSLDVSQSN